GCARGGAGGGGRGLGGGRAARGARGARAAPSCARSRAPAARSSLLTVPLLGDPGELADLALDPRQLAGHDRDIDEDQGEEDEVGAGDVLAGFIEWQRRHQRSPGSGWAGSVVALGPTRLPLPPGAPSIARRRRESSAEVDFASSSKRTRVSHRSAIPASETRNVNI